MRISGGKLAYYLAAPAHASILYEKGAVLPETALSHNLTSQPTSKFCQEGRIQGLVLLLTGPPLET
jgi:hypothetical protein